MCFKCVIFYGYEILIVELSYGNTVALEQSIDKAYLTTTSKLVELMKVKFGFWEHLNAFKKYILLGQGDFIAILMESIGYVHRISLFMHPTPPL